MTWQIAGVKKPLASVGRMCDAGNLAIFADKGGYIICRDGAKDVMSMLESKKKGVLRMRRENGVYNFSIRVPATREKRGIQTGSGMRRWWRTMRRILEGRG